MRLSIFLFLSVCFLSACASVPRNPACENNSQSEECKVAERKERSERIDRQNMRGGRANR